VFSAGRPRWRFECPALTQIAVLAFGTELVPLDGWVDGWVGESRDATLRRAAARALRAAANRGGARRDDIAASVALAQVADARDVGGRVLALRHLLPLAELRLRALLTETV
jgi:hypothetical protein